ncbi:ABC transporter [Streptomyces sp. NPDC089915]|uniref:ABC transporter n=1 Tax=Streptomyces sp. NPDC089915 TaxID=3155186 RepID=UPI00343E377D
MTALLRYQGALLLRSQGWLAPFAVYAVFMGIGIQPGDRTPDSLGYAAAGLVPLAAWLVRVCATAEPPAARACTSAAAGPARTHAAALLTGLGAALLTGLLAAAYTLLVGDPAGHAPVPVALAGVAAVAVCALTGAAVGAVCGPPLVPGRGLAVLGAGVGSLLAWVAPFSPARAAVSALIGAARAGAAEPAFPAGASAGALLLAGAAGALVCLRARPGAA